MLENERERDHTSHSFFCLEHLVSLLAHTTQTNKEKKKKKEGKCFIMPVRKQIPYFAF